jgi:hypothetical protein
MRICWSNLTVRIQKGLRLTIIIIIIIIVDSNPARGMDVCLL